MKFLVLTLWICMTVSAHGCVQKADIVFLLDASGSVSLPNFQKMLQFTTDMLDNLTISEDEVHIGVATFDNTAIYCIKLGQYNDTQTLQAEIMKIRYTGGGTQTDVALQFGLKEVFVPAGGDRPDAKNVLVVLTDGISSNRENTIKQAYTYREKHIQVISIGIGRYTDQSELTDIASVPGYVFNVADFTKLSTIQEKINELACNNDEITTPRYQWFLGR